MKVNWTNRTAVIRWKTNERATSRVRFFGFSRRGLIRGQVSSNEFVTDHSLRLTKLRPRTGYNFIIECRDRAGNRARRGQSQFLQKLIEGGSGKILQPPGGDGFFLTDSFADTQLPIITGAPRILEKTADSFTVAWETDEVADSFIRFGTTEELDQIVGNAQDVQSHVVTLTNLTSGQRYHFQAESTDPSGNGAATSSKAIVSTGVETDFSPPRLVEEPRVVAQTDDEVVLAWRTDEAAAATIEYEDAEGELFTHEVIVRQNVQQTTITNLTANTEYVFRMSFVDASQNETPEPFLVRTQTDSGPDLEPPRIVDGPHEVAITDRSATITWTTDELADSYVDFDESPYLGSVIGDPVDDVQHRVLLTNLEPNTTYHYRVGSSDRAGNGPTVTAVMSFATRSDPDGEPPAIPDAVSVLPGSGANLVVWEPNTEEDLTGYSVYREQNGTFEAVATNLTEPRFLDQGLVDGQVYRYRISASDNQSPPNESEQSSIAEGTPSVDLVSGTPMILGLEQGAEPQRPILVIQNAVPVDAGAELTYTVHISTSSNFTTIVAREGNIPEGFGGSTRWRVDKDLVRTRSYWWRARVFDGQFEGPWSEPVRLRPNQASVALTFEDFNGDGRVSFGDFFILANGFGSADPILDLDRDGQVGSSDLGILKQKFGETNTSKLANSQGAEVAKGSNLQLRAEAFHDGQVALRLRLHELPKLTGYGFSVRTDPPILQYVGTVDTALALGGRETRLHLVHEEGGVFAFADHVKGRQSAVELGNDVGVDLLFRLQGPPRNVEFVVEEGLVGRGAGRAWRVEQLAFAKVVPTAFALHPNYPNPFNPSTTLPVAVSSLTSSAEEPNIELSIYNVLGQRMRTWNLNGWEPGFHSVQWDGFDDGGRSAASGVYMVRLRAGRFDQTRKLLLLC